MNCIQDIEKGRYKIQSHIRWITLRDMPEVLEIEQENFEYSWKQDDFVNCLKHHSCVGMVAEHDGQVLSYMIYVLHSNRIHLLNLAVSKNYHRCGIGTQMIAKLVGKLSLQRRRKIVTEIRETNLDAQLFFRELGFKAIHILNNHYEETEEDAFVMSYNYCQ